MRMKTVRECLARLHIKVSKRSHDMIKTPRFRAGLLSMDFIIKTLDRVMETCPELKQKKMLDPNIGL